MVAQKRKAPAVVLVEVAMGGAGGGGDSCSEQHYYLIWDGSFPNFLFFPLIS